MNISFCYLISLTIAVSIILSFITIIYMSIMHRATLSDYTNLICIIYLITIYFYTANISNPIT